MKAPVRVGWLGGSFDPVHEGHLAMARVARERLGLARVLLVPARAPPHKLDRQLASGADRLALLEIACADEPELQPCDLELHREGPSYSVDTAHELLGRLDPGAELFAIVGADTLADLPTWHRIVELAGLVTFCAVTRPGTELGVDHLRPLLSERTVRRIAEHRLPMPPHPASSTAVRQALWAGRNPEHVPGKVLAEIRRRGLYSSGAEGSCSRDRSGR